MAKYIVTCKLNGVVKSMSFRQTEDQVKRQREAWEKLGADHQVEIVETSK